MSRQEPDSRPLDFPAAAAQALANTTQRTAIRAAVLRQYTARRLALPELPDALRLRELASQIRRHALDHLDHYLLQLKDAVERNGGHVHFAADATEARRIILDIAQRARCRHAIKSKSMVSEEIHLLQALRRAGLDVVETDLGEFILQISDDRPSHLVGPVIHKNTASIARLFSHYFHTPCDERPDALAAQARAHLREKFRQADLGITGANFLVAQTGQVCVVSNEGNARQSITSPRVLVTLTGIEKVIPRLADLAVMLKLLGRSSTGQPMTVYTSLFGSPRAAGEIDGPDEFHLVLLDNGRSRILATEYRESLKCIRCGACLNACPVYRNIGGHAYGHAYCGPIGAVILPLLEGMQRYAQLPHASTLCGACLDACPVQVDIPRMLVNLRRDTLNHPPPSDRPRIRYRLWAWAMSSPLRYRLFTWIQRRLIRRRANGNAFATNLPGLARAWTDVRDMPAPPKKSFRQLWKTRPRSR